MMLATAYPKIALELILITMEHSLHLPAYPTNSNNQSCLSTLLRLNQPMIQLSLVVVVIPRDYDTLI